jgi:hypothetical protein
VTEYRGGVFLLPVLTRSIYIIIILELLLNKEMMYYNFY